MKKLLLIAACALSAPAGFAQDCANAVATAGNVKTQAQKATCTSADNKVTATIWLSRNESGQYIHINPVVNADKSPFQIKGKTGERLQMVFINGSVMDSHLIKKSGNEAVITLSNEIITMLATVPVESISWFENNAMQPSLYLPVNDNANQKLIAAADCLK